MRTLGRSLEFLESIWRLNHGMERVSSRMMRELGVTGQQRLVVRCIGKFSGLSAGELATLLHLDRGTISSTLRRLEARKLIARKGDPADRRRATIVLTAAGRKLDQPMPDTIEGTVEKFLGGLRDEEVSITMRVLGELGIALQKTADRGR